MTTEEQEVQELFDSIAVPIPGAETLHATTLERFELAAKVLYNSGFQAGYKKSSDFALKSIQEVLNPTS